MYRPEGWENPYVGRKYPKRKFLPEEITDRQIVAYETGADAMLEGLFKMAKESPTGTFVIDSREVNLYTRGGIN